MQELTRMEIDIQNILVNQLVFPNMQQGNEMSLIKSTLTSLRDSLQFSILLQSYKAYDDKGMSFK